MIDTLFQCTPAPLFYYISVAPSFKFFSVSTPHLELHLKLRLSVYASFNSSAALFHWQFFSPFLDYSVSPSFTLGTASLSVHPFICKSRLSSFHSSAVLFNWSSIAIPIVPHSHPDTYSTHFHPSVPSFLCLSALSSLQSTAKLLQIKTEQTLINCIKKLLKNYDCRKFSL